MTQLDSNKLDAIAFGVQRAINLGLTQQELLHPTFKHAFAAGDGVLVVVRRGNKHQSGMFFPKHGFAESISTVSAQFQ